MLWIKAGKSLYAVSEVVRGRVYSLRKEAERPGRESPIYDVCWDDREGATCTCASYSYRGDADPMGCKHTRAMILAGFIPDSLGAWHATRPRTGG